VNAETKNTEGAAVSNWAGGMLILLLVALSIV